MKYYKNTMRIIHFLFGFVIFSMASLALNFVLGQRTKFTTGSSFELDSIVPLQQDPLQTIDPISSKSKLNKRTKRLIYRYDSDMKKEKKLTELVNMIRKNIKQRQIDKEMANKAVLTTIHPAESATIKGDQLPTTNRILRKKMKKVTQKPGLFTFYLDASRFNSNENSFKHRRATNTTIEKKKCTTQLPFLMRLFP